jgi:hypothetical protein
MAFTKHHKPIANSRKTPNRVFLHLAQLTAFAACSISHSIPMLGAAEAATAEPAPAAENAPKEEESFGVKINDYFSVDGYAAVSGTLSKTQGQHRLGTLFNSENDFLDAVKIGLNFNSAEIGATVSFFYVPGHNADCEAGVLDAFTSWKKEFGKDHSLTLTAGKFTSYLAFEGFHPIERDFLNYALVAGVPGYHTGLKADYENGPCAIGFAVLDSLQSDEGFYQGDGNLRDVGFELCASYKMFEEKLLIYAGVGYDTDNKTLSEHGFPAGEFEAVNNAFFDLYATFKATETLTLAAEITNAKHVSDFSWLVQATQALTDTVSVTGRISGAKFKNGTEGYQFGIAPQWQPIRHLLLRGEFSHQHFCGGVSCWFCGALAIFQFSGWGAGNLLV